jgi:hypothetical protein
VEDGDFLWDVSAGRPMAGRVLLTGATTTVNLVLDRALGATEAKPTYKVNDGSETTAFADPATSGQTTKVVLDLTKLTAKGPTLNISLASQGGTTQLTLVTPLTGATDPPQLLNTYNSPFLDIPGGTAGTATVYAPTPSGSYLRLQGTASGSPTLRFFMRLGTDPASEITPTSGSLDPVKGTWDYTFNLGQLPPNISPAKITVRADFPGRGDAYLKSSLSLQITAAPQTLDAPIIPSLSTANLSDTTKSIQAAADLSTKDITAYRANTTSFSKLTVPTPTGAQAVVVTLDGKKLPPPSTGSDYPAFDVGTGRDHVIKAFGVVGPLEGKAAQIQISVRTVGPSISTLLAPGFGTGGGTEKITIQFSPSSQLDKTSAQTTTNYSVTGTNGTSTNPQISSAIYDPIADTVTLTLTNVTPGSYLIGLPSGATKPILDLYGNPVQTVAGAPTGFLYQTTLVTQSPDQLTSPTAGVTLTPGPPVTFPEYAPRTTFPTGFNPGDHVETRVVRLYYYRDAHRVAMIVNRSVKSYSSASVDVRQRAADRARDDADAQTIERKRLEGIAVQKAQAARAAEAAVKAAENQAATAKTESAQASLQLSQQQIQLNQANQNLNTAVANNDFRKSQDPTVLAAKARLDSANAALASPPTGSVPSTLQANANAAQLDYNTAVAAANNRIDNETKASTDALRQQVAEINRNIQILSQVAATGTSTSTNSTADISALQQKMQAARDEEVQATQTWQVQQLQEQNLRANQFRREVAAATADPNTYAPGKPDSIDPVEQVSISVIGEGLIQLRGPIKGINIIRIMINQMDMPCGQVRITVHTVQINGERGNRMEKVAANIQRYLDHSRFLTAQSAQMLRKAVTMVASRKAEEVVAQCGSAASQWDRDQKYLYAFFGKDFIDELILLDSEFLKTGNKLLSLHSMDSTSLSSALFLMALAKNEVRREILAEFMAQLERDLPQAEFQYYLAGLSGPKCEACCDKKQYMLAYNAKFQSLLGFFNAEVSGNDTITPIQREFVRLAQIFKAQLVTEIALKQRYLERSLVEERIGTDYIGELKKAKALEDQAKLELGKARDQVSKMRLSVSNQFVELTVAINGVREELTGLIGGCDKFISETYPRAEKAFGTRNAKGEITIKVDDKERIIQVDQLTINGKRVIQILPGDAFPDYEDSLMRMTNYLNQLVFEGKYQEAFKSIVKFREKYAKKTEPFTIEEIYQLKANLELLQNAIIATINRFSNSVELMVTQLGSPEADSKIIYGYYVTFRKDLLSTLKGDLLLTANKFIGRLDIEFTKYLAAVGQRQLAYEKAQTARRPLDEKKFLDLLVDDTEDKFIEQLEGTRAHTANVDNYVKSLSTALDDDFNTQFYLPSFRKVREASRMWDVTLGQIESTSILANNRSFAKVSPSATFEFDLPKRDIMITEGFKAAKALTDDVGALINDPSFLALAKLYSGVPSTGQINTGGGLSSVRNVLPGLGSSPDEMLLAQAGPGRREFGSALEGLIPDPAIYKFETGTGYEIRPVLAPDGQAVVFNFQYLYTTDVREPVRADEKHLGRVKRHFVNTDVQLSNFELREVSKYVVALKAARTAKGVPLLQDIPGLGLLFRPLPSAESSLQENLIYSQATIFPTLFDLMGLRYAQQIADLDPLSIRLTEFAARGRALDLMQRTADIGATRVDEAVRIPFGERRSDLYRPQVSIPYIHPNGYQGPGLRNRDSNLIEGPPGQQYDPRQAFPATPYSPYQSWPSATKPLQPQDYMPPAASQGGGYPAGGYPVPGYSPGMGPTSSWPMNTPGGSSPTGVNPGSAGTTTIQLQRPGVNTGTAHPAYGPGYLETPRLVPPGSSYQGTPLSTTSPSGSGLPATSGSVPSIGPYSGNGVTFPMVPNPTVPGNPTPSTVPAPLIQALPTTSNSVLPGQPPAGTGSR